jgi:hypothetical protein
MSIEDEAFGPIVHWPIQRAGFRFSDDVRAKLDGFLREGASIHFDLANFESESAISFLEEGVDRWLLLKDKKSRKSANTELLTLSQSIVALRKALDAPIAERASSKPRTKPGRSHMGGPISCQGLFRDRA